MSDIMVEALKSQVVGLQLARRQSNEVITKLMVRALNEEQRNELFALVVKHCAEQDRSRAAQMEAVMRTATMQLNQVAQSMPDSPIKQQLVETVKALTLTVECASLDIKKEKK